MEWHINTWDTHVSLAVRAASLALFSQCRKTRDGAGDSVLLACQVEIYDFEELTGFLRQPINKLGDLVLAYADLVRTQGAQTIVGPPLLITFDQFMHGQTAAVDNLQHGVCVKRTSESRQRVVLTDRVSRKVSCFI